MHINLLKLPCFFSIFNKKLYSSKNSSLKDMTVTEDMLANGDKLVDMRLPKGTLVMIIKRGQEYIVPNGTVNLHVGDKLLLISEN